MSNKNKIKLDEPVEIPIKFEFKCANCGAYLFATDNFCPCCGENVSGCLGVVVLKSEADSSQENFTMEDAIKIWEEEDTDG